MAIRQIFASHSYFLAIDSPSENYFHHTHIFIWLIHPQNFYVSYLLFLTIDSPLDDPPAYTWRATSGLWGRKWYTFMVDDSQWYYGWWFSMTSWLMILSDIMVDDYQWFSSLLWRWWGWFQDSPVSQKKVLVEHSNSGTHSDYKGEKRLGKAVSALPNLKLWCKIYMREVQWVKINPPSSGTLSLAVVADSSRAFTAVTEGQYCHQYHHHLPPDVSYAYKLSSPLFQLMS